MEKKMPKKNNIRSIKPGKPENKKNRKKRKSFMIFILCVAIMILSIFIFLPQFKIKTIDISGEKYMNKTEIQQYSKEAFENVNIFYAYFFNKGSLKNKFESNPYFKDCNIKLKLPNKIEVHIDEVTATYYIHDGQYTIYDDLGNFIQNRNDLNGMGNLIQIVNLNYKNNTSDLVMGDILSFINLNSYTKYLDKVKIKDEMKVRQKAIIETITALNRANSSGINMSKIDMKDVYDMRIYYKNMEIRVGDASTDLKKKLNIALNIIIQNKISDKTGYVDVSDWNIPVYKLN